MLSNPDEFLESRGEAIHPIFLRDAGNTVRLVEQTRESRLSRFNPSWQSTRRLPRSSNPVMGIMAAEDNEVCFESVEPGPEVVRLETSTAAAPSAEKTPVVRSLQEVPNPMLSTFVIPCRYATRSYEEL